MKKRSVRIWQKEFNQPFIRMTIGTVVESATEESAVWELMYFGKAGADKKTRGGTDNG